MLAYLRIALLIALTSLLLACDGSENTSSKSTPDSKPETATSSATKVEGVDGTDLLIQYPDDWVLDLEFGKNAFPSYGEQVKFFAGIEDTGGYAPHLAVMQRRVSRGYTFEELYNDVQEELDSIIIEDPESERIKIGDKEAGLVKFQNLELGTYREMMMTLNNGFVWFVMCTQANDGVDRLKECRRTLETAKFSD